MLCENVGETNPDIAGLGIFIAFAFQAGISVVLSICSMMLWKDATAAFSDPDGPFMIYPQMMEWIIRQVTKQDFSIQPAGARERCEEDSSDINEIEKAKIDEVLKMISDIQILNALAILLAALIQWQTLSLYHMHIVYDMASFTAISACASFVCIPSNEMWKSRRLLLLSYVGTFIPFIIVFLIRIGKWDPSIPGYCYNSPTVDGNDAGFAYIIVTSIYSLLALYLCYLSSQNGLPISTWLLKVCLNLVLRFIDHHPRIKTVVRKRFGYSWTWTVLPPGFIFLGNPLDNRPHNDYTSNDNTLADLDNNVYLRRLRYIQEPLIWLYQAYTRYTERVLSMSRKGSPAEKAPFIASIALLQYPLHLTMAIIVRKRNERLLEGDSENQWGFGQIVALLLCAGTLVECFRSQLFIGIFKSYRGDKKTYRAENDHREAGLACNGDESGPSFVI
ncbi:hypothetical protein NXS19_013099 [Fusarium pseudograminearum]|nr:hypothetical protein NXS19_013099 [Fusarium pseudograminearum]